MTLTEEDVHKINLLEILSEEAEAEGRLVQEPPPEASKWTEEQIREYYRSGGKVPGHNGAAQSPFPPPSSSVFSTWFPGLPLSRTATDNPRLLVLCFPNAGSAEDMYTSEGTGIRRAPSPLLAWCRANGAQCLAAQYPGRALRNKEPFAGSAAQLASALLAVVGSTIGQTPYVIVAHSLGTWVAYEFIAAARDHGLPMPRHVSISALCAPDLPFEQRPWRQQRSLDEENFKEECRGWAVSEVVFSAAMWPVYQPLIRADFRLFDEYEFRREGEEPFDFPIHAYWGTKDPRIKQWMVQGWQRFTTGKFVCSSIEGNHLWTLEKNTKHEWLASIAADLERVQL